jgi:hypothetical protein
MSDILSKHHPLNLIFNLGNKLKSQEDKSGEKGQWGTRTMLLVTNSVVFRDVCAGALS